MCWVPVAKRGPSVSQAITPSTSPYAGWFCHNALETIPTKFQGILFKGNKQVDDFKISAIGHDIEFSKSMTSLGICIEYTVTFDSHINDICLKASRQGVPYGDSQFH